MRRLSLSLSLTLILLMLAGCGGVSLGEIKSALRQQVAAQEDSTLAAFYDERDYAPYWAQRDGLSAAAGALLQHLCRAADEALNPADYGIDTLEALYARAYGEARSDSVRARRIAVLEIALSDAFVRYARDVTEGRVRPEQVNGQWHMRGERFDAGAALRQVAAGRLSSVLEPRHQGYVPLRDALARYRAVAAAGGWPAVPQTLAPGDGGSAVEMLRQRLVATGDLDSTATGAYDEAVTEAVRRFQRRHGLPETGSVDEDTRVALNVSAEARARQLALNLERRRWMPAEFGSSFILVNIPDYHLYAYANGERTLDMPVIVGEEYTQTPVFADTMQYVAFAPYWNVPPSITRREILPAARRDPSYLAAHRYEVVSAGGEVVSPARLTAEAVERGEVRVRQMPGPHNALGGVKFMFPNQYDIYLHDTPATSLFDRQARTFSHGCIRVADPEALARFVLGSNSSWSAARIREAMQGDAEQEVPLKRRLPVYITYLTAWVEGDGSVQFRGDVYGHDARIAAALSQRSPGRAQTACTRLLNEAAK